MDRKLKIRNLDDFNPLKDKKFEQNKGFFEVNISLNNYSKEQFENSLEEANNKIYKRPNIYKSINLMDKGKSVDKANKSNILNDYDNPFNKRINPKKKVLMKKTKTNNYYLEKYPTKKNKLTYIKKNPHMNNIKINTNLINNNNNIHINTNAFNTFNTNPIKKNIKKSKNKPDALEANKNTHFVNKRNDNKAMKKERLSVNNFDFRSQSPLENYNFKKYNDIYSVNYSRTIKNNKNIIALNLEDLMVLEEKLCDIIIELKKGKKVDNQCFDFWNYFFNFSLYEKLEKVFNNETEEEIVKLCLNYELMSILICYDISFKNEMLFDCSLYIEILQICHKNLILIFEQVLDKITPENINNIWVLKLSEMVQYSKNLSEKLLSVESYIASIAGKINFNTNCLIKKIKNILYNSNNYENKNLLLDFVKNLNQKTYEEINDFFKENIYKVENYEGSILLFIVKNNTEYSNRVSPPYIKEPNQKGYSLVLDLNETLINFKSTQGNQGLVRTRPFLFEFLESISNYYEIILFTCSTKNYTDSIVKAIEYKKKYFDYIFYRQHIMCYKNDFVKDLTRIGRPLNSIIIIDNMPQNFKMQKENGINIKSFWGDNSEDTALYDLIPISIKIASEKQDVRDALKKYRDDIVKKVSSNISKHM